MPARPGPRGARVLEPFDDRVRPTDTEVRGGDDFERGAPTVEGEAKALAGDFGEDAAAEGVAALTGDVHLYVVDRLGEDEVEIALLGGLVLAGGEGDDVLFLQGEIAGVIFGRQGLLE